MRRAIAIVAISPRRISYITVTLLLFECKKRMYTRQSFTLPRPADGRRSPEVDRSELGSTPFRCRVGSYETRRVCSLRYRSTGTVSHSQALVSRGTVILQHKKLCLWCLPNTGLERRREKFLVAISITVITPRSR